jgi:hypothetical protein
VRLDGRHFWHEWDSVRSKILATWLANQHKREKIVGKYTSGQAQLFLSSILSAIEGNVGNAFFWHNSQPFRLATQCKDNCLSGRIEPLSGPGERADFRLTMQPGNPMPTKIEYQAKSFLRLTLVAV